MATSLFLGGARSGKSSAAQRFALAADGEPVYVATSAVEGDDEFADRVARHRADRGPRWRTLEVPLDLVGTLRDLEGHDGVVVIDCLTLWLSNLLAAEQPVREAVDALVDELDRTDLDVAVVSNEVGQGIVPMHPVTRAFRDQQGWLNQSVAAVADRVRLLVAGIEVPVKG